jgi:hypothetical protein
MGHDEQKANAKQYDDNEQQDPELVYFAAISHGYACKTNSFT